MEGMIQKEDCAGTDLDCMKGIVKEITVMQKLPRQFYEATGNNNSPICIELDFMKGIVKEMAGMQKPPKPMYNTRTSSSRWKSTTHHPTPCSRSIVEIEE